MLGHMKGLFITLVSVFSLKAVAYNCSAVKPFIPGGIQNVTATVSKFSWKEGLNSDEQICHVSTQFHWYDVRGREEEAYYCLKPDATEVISCNTLFNGEEAVVQLVPASWIRTWGSSDAREYRFHAYIVKVKKPDYFYDVFARSLQESLKIESITVEGSLKTGPANPDDGFWIRAEFQK
jgi:hypothetical protein